MWPILIGLSLMCAAIVVTWIACESWLERRGRRERPGYLWDDITAPAPARVGHTHHCARCGTWITHSGPAEACTAEWSCE